MVDRLTTVLALLLFTAFLAVVVIFVQEVDLAIIVLLVLVMAFVEFRPVILGRRKDAD